MIPSDIVMQAIVGGVITITLALIQVWASNRAKAGTEAVKKSLEETTAVTDTKMNDIAKVTNDTHTLVNSNMEKALQIAAVALRRVADLTNHEGDVKAAELAETALADHIKQQKKVDKRAEEAAAAPETRERKSIGDMARETMDDVKIVKEDVKDIKDST